MSNVPAAANQVSLTEYTKQFFTNAWRTAKITYHATAIICIAVVGITAYQVYQGHLVKYSGIASVKLGDEIQPIMQQVNADTVMPAGTYAELPTKTVKAKPAKQASLPAARPDPGIIVPADEAAPVPAHKPTPSAATQ